MYYTDEEMMKRLHYKPVKYVDEWVEPTGKGLLDKVRLVEATYDGVPIYYWENDYNNHINVITETQQWEESRDEVVETIKNGSVITKKQQLVEFWNGS